MSRPLSNLYDYCTEHRLWGPGRTLKRGEYLHQAGDRDANTYYIESGTLRYYVLLDDEPDEQVIRFGYAGDFTAAMDSLLHDAPTAFYAQALRKCTLRTVHRAAYRDRLREDPVLQGILLRIVRWMITGQLEREIDLLTTSPEARYRRVLARSPRLFQEIPAKYIANYLRMTPETLSRIRK